jgi:hypothetical protein
VKIELPHRIEHQLHETLIKIGNAAREVDTTFAGLRPKLHRLVDFATEYLERTLGYRKD